MRVHKWAGLGVVGLAGLVFAGHVLAANDLTPKKHFKIVNPSRLNEAEALSVYDNVRERMMRGYARSADRTSKRYLRWQRLNGFPYPSATHGNRYVNNYANAFAKGYGQLKPGQKVPAGSIIAKDSFTVTQNRSVFPGALFIMEKLKKGARPETGDWRYRMIMPDGSFFGDSEGDGADKVAFCAGCHKTVSETDYLFQVPEKYRRILLK